MNCPLCSHHEASLFDKDKKRSFYQCLSCHLVYVPRNELISPAQEKDRYGAHENNEESEGYIHYLSKIAGSIHGHLKPASTGLDFGSGKTTLLEKLLEEKGHDVTSYDVFFHPDVLFKEKKYDFIILSEVIEHLRDPYLELTTLKSLLKEDGLLFIKTKLLPEQNFSNWFYKRDMTHVQFFSMKSFRWISVQMKFHEALSVGEDLFLFRNN